MEAYGSGAELETHEDTSGLCARWASPTGVGDCGRAVRLG